MKLIDFHTHIYPDAIAEKAAKSVLKFYEFDHDAMNGTVDTLLERGKKAGVCHYVVLPVGLNPGKVRHINQFILDEVAKHPEFTGFGTIHAAMENMEEEVEFIQRSGLKGVKMHPDTQMFAIDDPRLYPVYDMMQGKMPVMLHVGDPRHEYSRPEKLRKIMKEFPRLEVIAAHFGGWSLYETAYENLHDMNCVMDISSSLMFMDREYAVKLIRRFGPERLLYGTDYPLWDPVVEAERFLALGLTDGECEQIAWKTAQRFL